MWQIEHTDSFISPKQSYLMRGLITGKHKCILVFLVSLLLIQFYGVTNSNVSANSNSDDWPMFHADPSRSGAGPKNPEVTPTVWTYFTGGAGVSSPAVSDGTVYIGSDDGKFYTLNASNGASLWNYTTGLGFDSSPAVVNGVVYIGSDNIYALNATNGIQIWNYTIGNGYSSPAVVNDIVYFGAGNHLYALNATSGAKLWIFTIGKAVYSSPAVVGGVVYFGSLDNNVYALDASSGAKLWSYSTQNAVYSSPAVANGVVYISSWDGNVYALNAYTGVKLWNHNVGSPLIRTPTVANGMVYILSIYALNASTGVKIWTYDTGGLLSVPAVVDGVVYIGSSDYNVYALNAFNGEKIWNYATGYYVDSSPAVAYGMVYVGSDDGYVYALRAAPAPTDTTIPTPTATPSATTVSATTDSGAIVDLSISGNITSSQMSNITITTNQFATSTTLYFTVTVESDTTCFSNITIPKSAVPYGTTPAVYLDNQPAQDQGYTKDSNNYYVWYTTSFGTHQVSIVFTTPPKISLLSPLSQTYNESSVSLVFTVDKPVNWTGYSLDGEQNVTIAGNTTITGLSNGLHNVTVYAKDLFDNVGASETVVFIAEPFPVVPVAAAVIAVAVFAVAACAGLLLLNRKRRQEAGPRA